jgi:hypothetical protein
MTLILDTSTVWLEVPEDVLTTSWQQSETMAISGDRWQAHLNQISVSCLLPYLRETLQPEARPAPHPVNAAKRYGMVNGSSILLGDTRFVLIPSETLDKREFWVPQEWIDIPSWVGDYYLAVEVNPDDRYLHVWGYTTHQILKSQGEYDSSDRAYCLDGNDLIPDMNVLWIMHSSHPEPTRAPVVSLPPLPLARTEALIQQLGDGTIALPRFQVAFAEWGALLEQPDLLQQLCQRRQGAPMEPAAAIVQLSDWFQSVITAGWQTVEALLADQPELAFNFRTDTAVDAVRRVKLLRVGSDALEILLLVMLQSEPDGRISIRVRLLPTTTLLLPPQLRLTLRLATGEVLQSMSTRDQDNSMQLKRFKCQSGVPFRIEVSLDGITVSEDFIS